MHTSVGEKMPQKPVALKCLRFLQCLPEILIHFVVTTKATLLSSGNDVI